MHSPEKRSERVLGKLIALGNPFFQIESLYRFNAKFFPRWEPRFLVYEGDVRAAARGDRGAVGRGSAAQAPDRSRVGRAADRSRSPNVGWRGQRGGANVALT